MKILLRDHAAVHAETKFIATGRREEEGGDVDTEVGNLQTISNDDVGERCAADQLVCIDEHQIDFDAIRAFGVGHAEVQAELMVLKRERHRLEVGEQADQRFFLSQAIFDDAVADEERLHAGRRDVSHAIRPLSAEHRGAAAGLEDIPEQRMGGSDATEVRRDLDELAAVRIEFPGRHVDFFTWCDSGFQDRFAGFLVRDFEPWQIGKEGRRGLAGVE